MTKVPHYSPETVNVFITSYNRAQYLIESVESVLAQTYPHIRIQIYDDGSTDGASEIASQFQENYPAKVVSICKTENRGIRDSLNSALRNSRESGFFAFLADDDKWDSNKIERQIEKFNENDQTGLIHTEAWLIDEVGDRLHEMFSDKYPMQTKNITEKILLNRNFICASSVIVRTAALGTFNYEIPKGIDLMADCYMWLAVSSSFPVEYLHNPTTFYRVGSHSVQENFASAMQWEIYSSRKIAYKTIPSISKVIPKKVAKAHFSNIAYSGAKRSAFGGEYSWLLKFFFSALSDRPSLIESRNVIFALLNRFASTRNHK